MIFKKIYNSIAALLRGGFFHILSGNVLSKAITMISSIVVTQFIEKTEYGYFSYANNLYGYISLVAGLGMASALLKYCGENTDKSKDKAYIRFASKWGGTFQIFVAMMLCVITSFVEIPFPKAGVYIWALCLTPAFSYIATVCQCYIRTQGENRKYAVSGIIASLTTCIGSIVFLFIMKTIGLVVVNYVTSIFVILYLTKTINKRLGGIETASLTKTEKNNFTKMAVSLMIAVFFSGIMPINESFLVNNIIKDEIVTANFQIAGLFPQLLLLVSGAVTVYYFPIIAQLNDWDEIRRKVFRIGILNGAIILFLAVVGMLCTPIAIKILYGEKYVDAIPMSFLLWIMNAMNCCIRMVPINMLPAIGKTKFNAYMSIISCILQCIIDYYCITNMGIGGVALGATIVYFISGVAFWLYFYDTCRRAKRNFSTG